MTHLSPSPLARGVALPLGIATLLGLVLRLLAARGDFWLDEAWSAVFARDAATPAGVFFAINHDNNHFLNTLWLQLTGWGNSPMLGRALSIGCGAASVVMAGLIGARRGPIAALVAALLFAVSPALVTYGSEARGYGPMLLALLTAIWIVDRALFGIAIRPAPIWLGIVALLGMLAHPSMMIGVAALAGWVAVEQCRHLPVPSALRATIGLTGRAIAAVAAVLLLIAISAWASPMGFRMGIQTEFALRPFGAALASILANSVGWPFESGMAPLLLLALPILLLWRPELRDRAPIYGIAIIGLPLLVAFARPDNAAYPRYYLLSGVALLLLVGDLAATASAKGRWLWAILLIGLLAGSLALDAQLIANRRADPGRAVAAIAARAPGGSMVMIDNPRDYAVLHSAAAVRRYRLGIVQGCGDTPFLFLERNRPDPFPALAMRCGAVFRPVTTSLTEGLSGMDWRLYGRVGPRARTALGNGVVTRAGHRDVN